MLGDDRDFIEGLFEFSNLSSAGVSIVGQVAHLATKTIGSSLRRHTGSQKAISRAVAERLNILGSPVRERALDDILPPKRVEVIPVFFLNSWLLRVRRLDYLVTRLQLWEKEVVSGGSNCFDIVEKAESYEFLVEGYKSP
ncbi:hypothetical protein GCM10011529_31790 [Polymorphobacter glacialis]|uniref:Uncharacterized protein n=1 Tax=Sandarakinorhabdus glacialis TaxID=1614636 RepID=A0A917A345_9SPHN|nr:hypothetical protein GCM10011529_31790 [Polymorphobacter glacialis]